MYLEVLLKIEMIVASHTMILFLWLTQITGKEQCRVVLRDWIKADNYVWNFELTLAQADTYVHQRETMTYKHLVAKVKDKLGLRAHDTVIKLAYQYPSWMELDEGNGSEPQYIFEDNDVLVFVRIRRHIEEVDLYVTIVKKVTTQDSTPIKKRRHWMHYVSANSDGDSDEDQTDGDWYEFAMSPISGGEATYEHAAQAVDKDTISMSSIPKTARGITIRERADQGHLPKPSCGVRDKGKGVVEDTGAGLGSDSEEGDFRIVPLGK